MFSLTPRDWKFLGLTAILAFYTYFSKYSQPPAAFWDENYHIASAQKYLNHVYFMEPHPPLGKLLIAAGEKLLRSNAPNDARFIDTDYGRDFKDFSFTGYRLFPALMGWATAPLFFLVLFLITGSSPLAFFISLFYVFDNAFIVHMRGAMIEGPLIFFSLLMLLEFLLLRRHRDNPREFAWGTFALGMTFGLIMTTKLVGLIMILLIPALLWEIYGAPLLQAALLKAQKSDQGTPWPSALAAFKSGTGKFLGRFAAGFALTYVAVWYIHFALGSHIRPALPDKGYYQASEGYKKILAEGRNTSLLAFPVMLRDSWKFVGHYQQGVPKLDLCKEEENGSPFFLWPFGARTISYRWATPDSKVYRYLYLVANPAGWFFGLMGVALALLLELAPFFVTLKDPIPQRFLRRAFLGMYLGYMAVVSQIDRVMYLYHYFTPLLFSWILLALVLLSLPRIGAWRPSANSRAVLAAALATLVFVCYRFFSPLTYYQPLTDQEFQMRNWMTLWELHCVKCPRKSLFVGPRNPSTTPAPAQPLPSLPINPNQLYTPANACGQAYAPPACGACGPYNNPLPNACPGN